MKITEIKIGNWLYSLTDRDGQTERRPVRVTGIRTDGSDLIQGDDTDVWYPIEAYEPIPITSDILTANGFEDMGYFGKCEIVSWKVLCDTKNVTVNHGDHTDLDIPAKYVHELQNALSLCRIDKQIKL